MLFSFILLYLLLTIAIGWWASRRVKTTQDFVIAGRQLPLVVASCALFATWFGSETLMGAPTEFIEGGLIGVVEDPFGAALCLILIGIFFARKLYRLNILTFCDYFRMRFSRRAEFISAVLMVPSYFGWIAAQLVALALVLNLITGISLFWGILICMFAALIYTYIGGMWAVSVTDFVQTIIILVGLLILALQLNNAVGGIQTVIAKQRPGFFKFTPERDFNSILQYLAAWITIGLGSIPQQDVFQRVMAARNERVAVGSAYLSGFMYLTIAFIPLFIVLCSEILYPGMFENLGALNDEDRQKILPNMVLVHSDLWLQILFFGALLSAILSTTSGAILAPATVIGENLVRPYFKTLTDRQLLQIMRFSVVGVALASAIMAAWNKNIYELVGQSSAFSLVSLFVPLAAGLYWKRASNFGAVAAMVVGMAVWIPCEFLETEIPSLIWGLLASILAMVVGSFWKPDAARVALEDGGMGE
jgi:SSS family transporter